MKNNHGLVTSNLIGGTVKFHHGDTEETGATSNLMLNMPLSIPLILSSNNDNKGRLVMKVVKSRYKEPKLNMEFSIDNLKAVFINEEKI